MVAMGKNRRATSEIRLKIRGRATCWTVVALHWPSFAIDDDPVWYR